MNDQNIFNPEEYGNNTYQAPSAPQPSNSTFDYNQLYGATNTNVTEQKQEVVFDDS